MQSITVLVLFIFLACVLIVPVSAQINTSSIYRNDSVGVRGAFSSSWNIITSREQAPDVLKPNFPANKGPDDSPLFIGLHSSEQIFLRLISETFFDDLEAYAQVMIQGVESQGMSITMARLATDDSALEVRYRHPDLGLVFLERVALLPDSQVIRMAAWTSEGLWSAYLPGIEEAFSALQLNGAINAQAGWQPVWDSLALRLKEDALHGEDSALSTATPSITPGLTCEDPASSMLWKVASPELSAKGTEIYLFGSIHVGKPDFYPLDSEIEAIFREADHLVFEVDPATMADLQIMMMLQREGTLPRGQTLEDVISEEVLTDFRRLMDNIGIPADNFMTMQPWLLTLMLTMIQVNSMGYLPEYGLESYFLSQKPADADILELENIVQQIGFLQTLNAETFLAYSISDFDSASSEIEDMIQYWMCADKPRLRELLFDSFEDDQMSESERQDMEILMDSLYTRRNIDMAETIAGYADASPGRYFIVIGSAHLLGEGSVVELLQQSGFQVNPVRTSP